MKKFEYRIVNIIGMIGEMREKDPAKKLLGAEILTAEIINTLGEAGWELMNPPNVNELYLKREKQVK